MNQKQNISLSIQEKNGNAVPPSVISEKNNKTILTGTLTSRIEKKTKDKETYYYGFFKLEKRSFVGDQNYEPEIPVIFKENKPDFPKGTQVELTGTWSQGRDRNSFTCQTYQVLKAPEPPSLPSLQKAISLLLKPSLDQKKHWSETTDFLFKKQKELSEIKEISKLGAPYLKAYLLTRQVFYANYQAEHLEQANFANLETYLERIDSEVEITKRQMIAIGWKEVN